MKYEVKTEGDRTRLHLQDQLVHGDRVQFERVVSEVLAGRPSQVEVDFSALTYMDSAGLGFLLTLREKATAARATVVLAKPTGIVKDILDLARFDTLFAIR